MPSGWSKRHIWWFKAVFKVQKGESRPEGTVFVSKNEYGTNRMRTRSIHGRLMIELMFLFVKGKIGGNQKTPGKDRGVF
jgi:hypothetical protein